jgi:hypothetical protein
MKRAPIAVVTELFAALFTMVARQSAFLQLNGRFGEVAMTAAGPGCVETSQQSPPVGMVVMKICEDSALVVCRRPCDRTSGKNLRCSLEILRLHSLGRSATVDRSAR